MACFTKCFGAGRKNTIHTGPNERSDAPNQPLWDKSNEEFRNGSTQGQELAQRNRSIVAWQTATDIRQPDSKSVVDGVTEFDGVASACLQLRSESSEGISGVPTAPLPASRHSSTPINAPHGPSPAAARVARLSLVRPPALPRPFATVSAPNYRDYPSSDEAWVPSPKPTLAPVLLVDNETQATNQELGDFCESLLLSMQIRLKADAELSTFRHVPSASSAPYVARLSMGQQDIPSGRWHIATGTGFPSGSLPSRTERRCDAARYEGTLEPTLSTATNRTPTRPGGPMPYLVAADASAPSGANDPGALTVQGRTPSLLALKYNRSINRSRRRQLLMHQLAADWVMTGPSSAGGAQGSLEHGNGGIGPMGGAAMAAALALAMASGVRGSLGGSRGSTPQLVSEEQPPPPPLPFGAAAATARGWPGDLGGLPMEPAADVAAAAASTASPPTPPLPPLLTPYIMAPGELVSGSSGGGGGGGGGGGTRTLSAALAAQRRDVASGLPASSSLLQTGLQAPGGNMTMSPQHQLVVMAYASGTGDGGHGGEFNVSFLNGLECREDWSPSADHPSPEQAPMRAANPHPLSNASPAIPSVAHLSCRQSALGSANTPRIPLRPIPEQRHQQYQGPQGPQAPPAVPVSRTGSITAVRSGGGAVVLAPWSQLQVPQHLMSPPQHQQNGQGTPAHDSQNQFQFQNPRQTSAAATAAAIAAARGTAAGSIRGGAGGGGVWRSSLAPRSASWYGGAPFVPPDPSRVAAEVPVELRLCHCAAELLEGLAEVRQLATEAEDEQEDEEEGVEAARPFGKEGKGCGRGGRGSGGGSQSGRGPQGRAGWVPSAGAHGKAAEGEDGGGGGSVRSVVLQGRWQGQPVAVKLLAGAGLEPRNAALVSALSAASAVHSGLVRVYGLRLLPAAAAGALATAGCRGELEGVGIRAVRGLGIRVGEGVFAVIMELCSMGSLAPLIRAPYSPFRPNRVWPAYAARRALLRTALELGAGLAHLHAYGLAHGALRPGNVLRVPDLADRRNFRVKIADVALATRILELHPTAAPTHVAYLPTPGPTATSGAPTTAPLIAQPNRLQATAASIPVASPPDGSLNRLSGSWTIPQATAATPPMITPAPPSPLSSTHNHLPPSITPPPLQLSSPDPGERLFWAPEVVADPVHNLASPAADVFAFGMLLWSLASPEASCAELDGGWCGWEQQPPQPQPQQGQGQEKQQEKQKQGAVGEVGPREGAEGGLNGSHVLVVPGPGAAAGTVVFRVPSWPSGVHPQLRELYESCVRVDPEQRPNMEQVLSELRRIDEGLRSERSKGRAAAAASYAAFTAGRGGSGPVWPLPGFMP